MIKNCCFTLILLILCNPLVAKNYYVKNSGNDALSGLSIADAWKTIGKVNSIDFNAGDSLFFEAGSSFNGNMYLSEEDSGTVSQPLFIGSFGTGKATLYAHKSFGIYGYNIGGLHIERLNIVGLNPDSSTNAGIFFYTDHSGGKKFKHITLDQLDVSRFKNGVQFGSYHISYPGFSGIRLSNLVVHNNLQDGISSYDIADQSIIGYAHDSININHCYLHNNGFSGLVLGGMNGGTIERIKVSRSGHLHNKGVVGIWAWSSKNLLFQHCIADSTLTDGSDGCGFDLDGGTENCTIQYCYSFFNDGAGYMHCDYPKSRKTQNNTIRYCISEYDGQQTFRDKPSLLFVSWGSGLFHCNLYNNTCIIGNKAQGTISGIQGNILDGYDAAPKIVQCKAANNIVFAQGDSNFLVRMYNGKSAKIDTNALQLLHNVYYAPSPLSQKWGNDFRIINDIDTWRDSSNQERYKGKKSGWTSNPQLKKPGFGGVIMFEQIDSLEYLLDDYTLLKTSPIIDSGLDLTTQMSIDIGKQDFFSNNPLQGISQDIGCYETQKSTGTFSYNKAELIYHIYPNPCTHSIYIEATTARAQEQLLIFDLAGKLLKKCLISQQKQEVDISELAPGNYLIMLLLAQQSQILCVEK